VKRSFHEESERDGPLLGSPVNDTRSGTALGSGSLGHAMLLATDLENVVQAFLGRLSSLWRMSRCRPPGRTFCRGVVSHGCVFFNGRVGTGLRRATPRKQKSPGVCGWRQRRPRLHESTIATPVPFDCAEATI
jgi:hypothetical protein